MPCCHRKLGLARQCLRMHQNTPFQQGNLKFFSGEGPLALHPRTFGTRCHVPPLDLITNTTLPAALRGVALLLDKTLASAVTTWHPISDRLLYARLKHKHGHLSVMVAYAPTDLSPDADRHLLPTAWVSNLVVSTTWQSRCPWRF